MKIKSLEINKIFDISNIERIKYRKDINGLRAISVISVVLYHADIELFKGGWLGVDLFFVISGYLISNIIISELNNGSFTFKKFYIRRAKRIFPALFFTIISTLPLAYYLLSQKAFVEYKESLIASTFFYSNYHFKNLDFYIAESTKFMPLLHTWSLAIEEQFYILFPLLTFLVFKFLKKYFFLLVVLMTAFSIYLNFLINEPYKFYNIEFRIWELFIGVLVMIISNNLYIKNLEKIGFPLILITIFVYDDSFINTLSPKILALLGISFVIMSNKEDSFLSKFLSLKVIFLLGTWSFSIYLLHQPLFAFYRTYKLSSWENFVKNNTELLDFEILFLTLFCIFLGFLSYTYIEITIPKLSNKNFFIVVSILVLIIVLSFILINKDLNSLQEKVGSIEDNTLIINDISCHNRNIENLCKVNNDSDIKIVALGDSSLRSVTYWLGEYANEYNYNFESITGSACVFLYYNIATESSCPTFNIDELSEYVEKIENSYIIYSARLPLYLSGERFNNGIVTEPGEVKLNNNIEIEKEIIKTLNKLLDQKNKLIIIYPIPEQGWNVPELFKFSEFNIGDTISYPSSIWEERKLQSYNLLDSIKSEDISRIYPEDFFCNSFLIGQCVGAFENKVFYVDDDHLSIEGGKLVADKIIENIFEK